MIIVLDIDDCIYPILHDVLDRELALKTLELNVLHLVKICKKYNCDIALSSTWGKYITEDFKFIREYKDDNEKIYFEEGFKLLKPLFKYIKYINKGNRVEFILKFTDKRILILDDVDLSQLETSTSTTKIKFIKMNNFFDNFKLLTIHNFLSNNLP